MGFFSSLGSKLGVAAGVLNPVSALGTAVGLGGSFGDYQGAKETANSARDVAAQQVSSTREQMAFQERMSNSAFQRGTADMRSAGINPMLAADQGGASSPPGSNVGSLPVPQSPLTALGASAKDSIRMLQDLRESNERIRNLSYDTWSKGNQAQKIREDTEISVQSASMLRKQNSMLDEELKQFMKHPGGYSMWKLFSDRGLGVGNALDLIK